MKLSAVRHDRYVGHVARNRAGESVPEPPEDKVVPNPILFQNWASSSQDGDASLRFAARLEWRRVESFRAAEWQYCCHVLCTA